MGGTLKILSLATALILTSCNIDFDGEVPLEIPEIVMEELTLITEHTPPEIKTYYLDKNDLQVKSTIVKFPKASSSLWLGACYRFKVNWATGETTEPEQVSTDECHYRSISYSRRSVIDALYISGAYIYKFMKALSVGHL